METKTIESLPLIKIEADNSNSSEAPLAVEYELLPTIDYSNPREIEIWNSLSTIEERIEANNNRIDKLNSEIKTLTNQADVLDYAIAVTSGIITGIVDSIFVGEWNFENAKAVTNQEVNNKVAEFVKKDPRYLPWCSNTAHGRKARDPDRLETAIEFLEEHYHLPGDSAYQTGNFGITGNNHRLDDFCHHPTLVGLICSVIVQFTGSAIYSHNGGEILRIPIQVNEHGNFVGTNGLTKVMSGVINWFITVAKTIANQKGHLMSDIATPAGLPGSLLSTLKELSALPCFKDTMFSENLRRAYQNGIGTGKNQVDLGVFNQLFDGASSKFDKRTEMAVMHELKRQSIPVIINEALVRGFYFVRRFIEQIRIKKSLAELDWKEVLPFRNRTIVRMMTIATGTFTAFDVADAAIRSGGFNASCILRVNFVGVGRFAIAIGTDAAMGVKKAAKENQRMEIMGTQLHLLNAKVYYKTALVNSANTELFESQAETWVAAEDTVSTLIAARQEVERAIPQIQADIEETYLAIDRIGDKLDALEEQNPGIKEDLQNLLLWGEI